MTPADLRAWQARMGKYDDATWGVKCDGGYRVNRPGNAKVSGAGMASAGLPG